MLTNLNQILNNLFYIDLCLFYQPKKINKYVFAYCLVSLIYNNVDINVPIYCKERYINELFNNINRERDKLTRNK